MIIGGLEKISLLDFPGTPAAIVFTQGCNFRCRFCYNPMLVVPSRHEKTTNPPQIMPADLLLFLQSRVGKLDGVVITGGEPTIHPDLPQFIAEIKDLGFQIKLDTNGTNPQMLQELLNQKLLDYIAMDFKAPLEKYEATVKVQLDFSKIVQSVKLIMSAGVPYEFRTTMSPELIDEADILTMAETIRHAEKWYLQVCDSSKELVDGQFQNSRVYRLSDLEKMAAMVAGRGLVQLCQVR